MENLEKGALWVGRSLLGLYFLLPGVAKFINPDMHLDLMRLHQVPFAEPLLWVAGLANIVLGLLLLANRYVAYAAYGCVLYILVINIMLHDFWNFDGIKGAHETQNFVKNLGILAGCLILASFSRPRAE